MIKKVIVSNPKKSYEFDFEKMSESELQLLSITGISPEKDEIGIEEYVNMDGGIYTSSRSSFKNLTLSIFSNEDFDIEKSRILLYSIFIKRTPLSIRIITENNDVTAIGYVETLEPGIFAQRQVTELSIICPDSNFKSTKANSLNFYGSEANFQSPISNESLTEPLIEFSLLSRDNVKNVNYLGDIETGILVYIQMTGNVKNPSVYNLTEQTLTTIEYDFVDEDVLIINSQRGQKAITLRRGGIDTNIINYMDLSTDWLTLKSGDNRISFAAEEGTEYMTLYIEYNDLYGGV